MGFIGNILQKTVGNIFPKNTKVGQALGSTRTAGSGVIGQVFEKKEAAKVGNDMSLFKSGISGGVTFGKNQTVIIAIAAVIFAVAIAATRGFGLFAGSRRRRR